MNEGGLPSTRRDPAVTEAGQYPAYPPASTMQDSEQRNLAHRTLLPERSSGALPLCDFHVPKIGAPKLRRLRTFLRNAEPARNPPTRTAGTCFRFQAVDTMRT